MAQSKLVMFHVPDDEALLAAVGKVALLHEHMNYVLRMAIKTFADITVAEAIAATKYESSRQLRDRVRALARKRLGEGAPLLRLQAMLVTCETLTERRNELVHGIWAKELDGDPQIRDAHGTPRPVPAVQELASLAADIKNHTYQLNFERMEGFIKVALAARKANDA